VPDKRKPNKRVFKSRSRYWAEAAFIPAFGSGPVEVAIG
jgi:hypothetical protein